ncbi:MAG: hypothetical protein BHV76_05590 [Phocaeicola plebeius]|uniref:Uncharacterized protein n=1 Tax=Phocaeicola plebeius TaxID=310297 RepID=A0A854C2Z1_9BACT|nr:MAG: hypothetical protein BHV76_05590 [Phocaeicola plebeius]
MFLYDIIANLNNKKQNNKQGTISFTFTPQKNTSTFQLKRLSVLSKTYLRLNPNALVFSIKRKYVFPLCLKSPKFSLFIQKIYI